MTELQVFEAWAERKGYLDPDQEENPDAGVAWEAWQACRAHYLPEYKCLVCKDAGCYLVRQLHNDETAGPLEARICACREAAERAAAEQGRRMG